MAELVTDAIFSAALFPDTGLTDRHWGGPQEAPRLNADTECY